MDGGCNNLSFGRLFWQCDRIYKNISNIEKSSIISVIAEFLQKHYRIRGSVKIYSGEAYKHYKISFAMVILIILVLFAVSNLNDDLSIRFNDASESAYCDYMKDIEGVIDSDTENYLAKEQQYFDDLETERNEIFIIKPE